MNVQYIKNKKGRTTAVKIPIKEWEKYRKKMEKVNKKPIKKRRKKKVHLNDRDIREMTLAANTFEFWKSEEEDLYQDYLTKK